MKRHFSLLNATTKMTVALVMGSGLTAWHHSAMAADDFSLKMSEAIAPDRFFIRAGVIGVKVKTEAEDTYDVTGPVVTLQQLENLKTNNAIRDYLISKGVDATLALGAQEALIANPSAPAGIQLLINQMNKEGVTQLGTPKGIKAVAKENMGTAGLSLGYFLDDEYKWVVEAYVLAAPVKASVMVNKPSTYSVIEVDTPGGPADLPTEIPFGMQGKQAISSKILPPTVMLGRYFGHKNAVFRPFVGALAMYGLFYDVKVSDAMNTYVGGQNPGDTTATFKNTFGMGPMLGFKVNLSDSWHASLNVGHVKLKTVGKIVTRNSVFSINTPAIRDYGRDSLATLADETTGGSIYEVAIASEERFANPNATTRVTLNRTLYGLGGATRVITAANFVATKGVENPTFVREAKATLSNTLFFLSLGRSF